QIKNYDYFVLLNSDVEVSPQWLEPMVEAMEADRSIAACQPKILSEKKRDYFEHAGAAGGWLDCLYYPFCRGRVFHLTEKDEGQYDHSEEIFWASGAAMICRAKLFLDIGGFDDFFFAHMEEIDLCWRIKRAGYRIMSIPQSVVYHVGGGTLDYDNPRKVFLNFRNSLFMIFKNKSMRTLWWLFFVRLSLDGLAGILFLTEGKWKNILAILKAHFAFYRAIPQLRKRAKSERELIERVSISKEMNTKGILDKSIVLGFYLQGRRRFGELVEMEDRAFSM
ncbi:MAG TPA: glycosyltransferase family 2 protein, partial [Phaeodactylibacter sp.]|nr:glycosyltransferase family 2 protein [Phaeodactylibacter sp.]